MAALHGDQQGADAPPPSCPRRRRPAAAGASAAANARSASISAIARCCAPVSGNGSAPWKPSRPARRRPTCAIPLASRSSARLRSTSANCTRSSSSNTSRRAPLGDIGHRLGLVDRRRARVARSMKRGRSSTRRRQRVDDAALRRAAQRLGTAPPISHVLSPAFSRLRDTPAMIRPVLSPTRSTTGFVICRVPAVRLELAEEDGLGARRELTFAPRLVEERARELAGAVAHVTR